MMNTSSMNGENDGGLFEDPEFMAFGQKALEKMMAPTRSPLPKPTIAAIMNPSSMNGENEGGLFEDPEFMAFGQKALEKMMAPTKSPLPKPRIGIHCVICNRRVQQSNFTQTLGRLRPLIEHVKTHLEQRNYQCSECGYEAKTYVCASIHVKRMHDGGSGRVLDNSDEKYLFEVFERSKQAFPEIRPLIEEYFEQNKSCWIKAIQMKGSIVRSPTKNDSFFGLLGNSTPSTSMICDDTEPLPSSLDDILNTISSMENYGKCMEMSMQQQQQEECLANDMKTAKTELDEFEASCSALADFCNNSSMVSENGSRSSSEDAPIIKKQRIETELKTPLSPTTTTHPSLEIKKLYQLLAVKDRQLTDTRRALVEMHQKEKTRKQRIQNLEAENDKLIRILGQRELEKTKYEEKLFELNLRLETFVKENGHEEQNNDNDNHQ